MYQWAEQAMAGHEHALAGCWQEAQHFWEGVLVGVDRPVAREMMAQLDLSNLLGLDGGSTYGRTRKKAPLVPFFTQVKRQHPTKVLLVRVWPPTPLQKGAHGPVDPS